MKIKEQKKCVKCGANIIDGIHNFDAPTEKICVCTEGCTGTCHCVKCHTESTGYIGFPPMPSPTKPDREKICEKNCPDYSGMESFHKEQCDCSCHKPELIADASKKPVDMGIDSTCTRCEKRLCTCLERNGDKSWKEPDTEKWEVNFGRIASKAWKDKLWHSEATFTTDIKDFIRQEKEKSYEQGSEDAHIQIYEVHSEAEREIGRHSAYRKIIEEIEKSNRFPAYDNSIEAEAYMAGVNEFKNQFLSKLKEKLTQK